ncbi:hypothetical protein E2C01_099191 [Portunus trituberculatus]|uniref:Uncharacterized protein n=1 Tax=Portunus trituberculatus TaxID=210409 RepID=A0A5B7K8Y6_PORTR|nr:hypothetical protein [Portunus trituberculatus]
MNTPKTLPGRPKQSSGNLINFPKTTNVTSSKPHQPLPASALETPDAYLVHESQAGRQAARGRGGGGGRGEVEKEEEEEEEVWEDEDDDDKEVVESRTRKR